MDSASQRTRLVRRGTVIGVLVVLVIAVAALVFVARPAGPPNIVLITVDTLRADHLGAYGGEVRTPHVDRLAREGTVFERAACPMPLTRPSLFSMLTSQYPRTHGVLDNTAILPDEALTLAEVMKSNGYQTIAFIAMILLDQDSGGLQGFDRSLVPRKNQVMVPAQDVVSKAASWVRARPQDGHYFMWVHLFDPHIPYGPLPRMQQDVDSALAREHPFISWEKLITIAREHQGDIPAAYLQHAKRLYRGDVEYMDHWVGQLLEAIDESGSLDDTVVLFTADHGECFEKGVYFEHSNCLYQGASWIPLIVRYPPAFPSGRRVTRQVNNLAIAPTLLELAGLSVPDSFQGSSLRADDNQGGAYTLIQYPKYHPRIAEMQSQLRQEIKTVAGDPMTRILRDAEKFGLIGEDWKYLSGEGQQELYRMQPRPDEQHNLVDEERDVAGTMRRRLEAKLAELGEAETEYPTLDPQTLENLRSLGYAE